MARVTRRITARGWMVLASSVGLFFVAVHFSNNLIFLMAFFCISLVVMAMVTTWSKLRGVTVRLIPPEMAPVGGQLKVAFRVEGSDQMQDMRVIGVGLEAQSTTSTRILIAQISTEVRGVHRFQNLSVCAVDAFGLFQAARMLDSSECPEVMDLAIYPTPDWAAPAPAAQSENPAGSGTDRGEFAGLRPHRSGDALADVSWRATARHGRLVVKEYDSRTAQNARQFEWSSVSARGVEQALSGLSAAVLTALRDGVPTGLKLPGETVQAGTGPAHRNRLLLALARFKSAQ
ncbi:MAG: DUF58 domain-containing protein [Pseudomonadota bacterium]